LGGVFTGTSFGFSATASGEASEASELESLATVDSSAAGGDESDFGASPVADVSGFEAGAAGELAGFAGAGAAELAVPEPGLADAGAGGDGVALESAGAGGDPAGAVGFAAGGEVLAVPEDDGGGTLESAGSEVCVA